MSNPNAATYLPQSLSTQEIKHPSDKTSQDLIARCSEGAKTRRGIEIAITKRLIEALQADGYSVYADNGEDTPVIGTMDELLEELFAVDEARVLARKDGVKGWALLVLGNDGWDVIADYTTNLTETIDPLLGWVMENEI